MRNNATGDPSASEVLQACESLGLTADRDQAAQLALYLGALMRWNRKVNLVGARTWREALSNLAADSWRLGDFLDTQDLPADPLVYDLGAGAGLPGVPLRIVWPCGEYVMVEARSKRSAFLQYVLGLLGLQRTRVFAGRAENVLQGPERPDAIVSRAFMPWPEYLAFVQGSGARLVVVMANDPPPEAEEIGIRAPGWAPAAAMDYPSGGGKRYFWSFSPVATSM